MGPTVSRVIGRLSERVTYGPHEGQFVEMWTAPGEARLTVVFFHGGFWRSTYELSLMDALCEDVAERGWRAVNVEYRRGKGWAATAEDVRAGWDSAVELAHGTRLVTIGHSAGGQLVLWAATSCEPKPDLAVSLGGVADLAMGEQLALGSGAVAALLQGEPLAAADPAQLVPSGVPTLVVAARDDHIVPRHVSASYVDAARAAGDPVTFIEPPGDHFSLIDPASEAWAQTRAHLTAQFPELVAGE